MFGAKLDNLSQNYLPVIEYNLNNQIIWEEPAEHFSHHDMLILPKDEFLLVSIKLLREMGIPIAQNFLSKFGLSKSRLAPDLSLALGSSSFSPAEMVRAYSILANSEDPKDLIFVEKIIDRNGNIIYENSKTHDNQNNINGFPWFKTQLRERIKPFYLLEPLKRD